MVQRVSVNCCLPAFTSAGAANENTGSALFDESAEPLTWASQENLVASAKQKTEVKLCQSAFSDLCLDSLCGVLRTSADFCGDGGQTVSNCFFGDPCSCALIDSLRLRLTGVTNLLLLFCDQIPRVSQSDPPSTLSHHAQGLSALCCVVWVKPEALLRY